MEVVHDGWETQKVDSLGECMLWEQGQPWTMRSDCWTVGSNWIKERQALSQRFFCWLSDLDPYLRDLQERSRWVGRDDREMVWCSEVSRNAYFNTRRKKEHGLVCSDYQCFKYYILHISFVDPTNMIWSLHFQLLTRSYKPDVVQMAEIWLTRCSSETKASQFFWNLDSIRLTSTPSHEDKILYKHPMVKRNKIKVEAMDDGPNSPVQEHRRPNHFVGFALSDFPNLS